jgi:SAM-dependent methyltransferase
MFMDVLAFLGKDANILEIGCSAGRNLNYLYSKGYKNLTGIEIGIKAEAVMRECFPETYKSTQYIVGNAYEEMSKLPSSHYDLVFSHSVLVNISPKWNGIFKEMARVSKAYVLTMESEGSYTAYPRNFEKMFRRAGWKQILYKFYNLSGKKRVLAPVYVPNDMFKNNTLRLFVSVE